MRIISGKARGLHLKAPPGLDVRPTADRIKESFFSILGNVTGLTVVDLFAGSGALGLEALSRGATTVVFVERQSRHLRVLEANLASVSHAMGLESLPARMVQGDVRHVPRLLPDLRGRADLIFADPPYHPAPGEYGAEALLHDEAFALWAGPDAILALEHAADVNMPWAPLTSWEPFKQRQYGVTVLSFAQLKCGGNAETAGSG